MTRELMNKWYRIKWWTTWNRREKPKWNLKFTGKTMGRGLNLRSEGHEVEAPLRRFGASGWMLSVIDQFPCAGEHLRSFNNQGFYGGASVQGDTGIGCMTGL